MFSSKFSEVFRVRFLIEHVWRAASVCRNAYLIKSNKFLAYADKLLNSRRKERTILNTPYFLQQDESIEIGQKTETDSSPLHKLVMELWPCYWLSVSFLSTTLALNHALKVYFNISRKEKQQKSWNEPKDRSTHRRCSVRKGVLFFKKLARLSLQLY